jgi:hypothetical protein
VRRAVPTAHRLLSGLALLLAAALGQSAQAHRLAPSYLALQESAPNLFAVEWKTPRLVPRGTRLDPELPCEPQGEPEGRVEATAFVATWQVRCGGGLVGAEIGVIGLDESGTDALVHVTLADGREFRSILTAENARFRVPERESALQVLSSYLGLGVEHLATGLDHLLFVAGLVLLLGFGKKLLLAVTSFTLGHSLTLALAALGLVRFPAGTVEVAIAASLVVLARELCRTDAAHASQLARRPGALPFAFGLLHGLGFAGALAELGLPQQAIPLALFSFNVGIELGQLALIALALPLFAGIRRIPLSWPRLAQELPATMIGALGVFWCLQRSLGALLP